MIYSWIKSVIDSGKLTVFNDMNTGQWSTVFDTAISNFNKISGLKMQLIEAKSRDDANAVMMLADGSATFPYEGNSDPIVFDPVFGHGKTRMFRRDNLIEKAVSVLPINPSENHINVLRMITVHELVHACGLDNDEHSGDGAFMKYPNIRNGQIFSTPSSK